MRSYTISRSHKCQMCRTIKEYKMSKKKEPKDAFLRYAIYSLNLAILVCIAYSYFIFIEWHQGSVTVFDAVLASAVSTLIKVIPLLLIRSYLLRKYKSERGLDPSSNPFNDI